MKGSMPIPRIVALILAVAIIVIVAYAIFTQSAWMQNIILRKYCDALCFAYKSSADPGTWETYAPKCSQALPSC